MAGSPIATPTELRQSLWDAYRTKKCAPFPIFLIRHKLNHQNMTIPPPSSPPTPKLVMPATG